MDTVQSQENDSYFKELLTTLGNGFIYAFVVAGWILKNLFLGLLDGTGYLAIKFYQYILSPDAFRRYGKCVVLTGLFIVRSYTFVENICIYLSSRVKHTLYLNGRIGMLFADVETSDRDGYFILRQFGDDKMTEMNYKIENRWLARKDMLSSADLNSIMSQSLDHGLQVAYLYWKGRLMKPYDLAPLVQIKPIIYTHDRVVLPSERRWVADFKEDRIQLDPRKAQDIVHRA